MLQQKMYICILVLLIFTGTITRGERNGKKSIKQYSTNDAVKSEKQLRSVKTPKHSKIFVNETAQTGTKAILHCKSKEDNVTVKWSKKEDDSFNLLSVNTTALAWDKRFYVSYQDDSVEDYPNNKPIEKDFTLNIMYPKKSDEGLYQCKIESSNVNIEIYVDLKLIEAYAEIFGSNPRDVKAGFPLRLSCMLRKALFPPVYIFWFHEDRLINYDLQGGASIRHGRLGSELIIPRVEPHHAGNYSCIPSNAQQVNVIVLVHHGHTGGM